MKAYTVAGDHFVVEIHSDGTGTVRRLPQCEPTHITSADTARIATTIRVTVDELAADAINRPAPWNKDGW